MSKKTSPMGIPELDKALEKGSNKFAKLTELYATELCDIMELQVYKQATVETRIKMIREKVIGFYKESREIELEYRDKVHDIIHGKPKPPFINSEEEDV